MVSEKIYDPYDEERKKEEEKKEKEKVEALKEALRKNEESKKEEELKKINDLKSEINGLRAQIASSDISNEKKDGAFKMLDEAYGSLVKAEENIGSNNIDRAKGHIEYAQKLIEAASNSLSPNQNKDQSKGMGY
jgi:uncharacterized protein YPO0396